MTVSLDTLLEGAPAYGVLDAKDGVLLFRRPGFEAEFEALAEQTLQAAGETFEAIPLSSEAAGCDRIFIAPLIEAKSFAPER